MQVCFLFVCLSADYYKSNKPISLKLGPTSRKNGNTTSGRNFRSLFHFPHYCGIGHFGRFISISYAVTAAASHEARRNDCSRRQRNKSITFWSDPANIRIRINLEILIRILDHFWLSFRRDDWCWQRYAVFESILSQAAR